MLRLTLTLNLNLTLTPVVQQFLRIDGDDSAAHGELTAAVIESE